MTASLSNKSWTLSNKSWTHGITEKWVLPFSSWRKGKKGDNSDFPELAPAIAEQHHRFSATWNGRLPDLSRTVAQSSSLQVGTDSPFPCDLQLASVWLLCEALTFLALEVPVPAFGALLHLPSSVVAFSSTSPVLGGWKQSCSVCSFTRLLSWAFPHLYGPMFQGLLLPLIIYLLHLAPYWAYSAISVLVYLVPSNVPHTF